MAKTLKNLEVLTRGTATTIVNCVFTKDMTDKDIIKLLKEYAEQVPNMASENIIFVATTPSWDSDPRELHDIPEAKVLFKKLVDLGWYGLTAFPKAMGKRVLPDVELPKDNVDFFMAQFAVPACLAYGNGNEITTLHMMEVLKQSMTAFNTLIYV